MGRGIALSIRKQYPEAYRADCETEKGDRSKLGTISYAEVTRDNTVFVIVNAYTQFHWRGKGVLVDYDAVRKAMKEVKQQFHGKRLAYCKIGAGLAGGDWEIISAIINGELDGEDHTYVEFLPDKDG